MHVKELLLKLKQIIPEANWKTPGEYQNGILTTSIAFSTAKQTGESPQNGAIKLASNYNAIFDTNNLPINAEAAGPYVNLKFRNDLALNLAEIVNDFDYDKNKELNIFLEYVSPNVAKPLHAGHLRNIDIGESLLRILKTQYAKITTDSHLGDWGVQFGVLIWAWKQAANLDYIDVLINEEVVRVSVGDFEKDPVSTMVNIYIWGNQQKEMVANWDVLVREQFILLEQGDAFNLELWKKFTESTLADHKKDLFRLNTTTPDLELGESYYEKDVLNLKKILDNANLWEVEGGARYFDFTKMSSKKELCDSETISRLEKLASSSLDQNDTNNNTRLTGRGYAFSSTGYSTYLIRDIAARIHWATNYSSDRMITLTDHTQKHHFDQLFAILGWLSSQKEFETHYNIAVIDRLKGKNLVHLGYGFLSLPSGKMSTRKGNFLTARKIIDSVEEATLKSIISKQESDIVTLENKENSQFLAIAALKWADLSKDWTSDVVLDIEKITKFEGNTGVYQLYTFARLSGIINKNKDLLIDEQLQINKLNPDEVALWNQMYGFEIILSDAAHDYKPHYICNYLYSLASAVNSWYAKYSVTNEKDIERKQALIYTCKALKTHFGKVLELLAINTVESF